MSIHFNHHVSRFSDDRYKFWVTTLLILFTTGIILSFRIGTHSESVDKKLYQKFSYRCYAYFPKYELGSTVDVGTCFFVKDGERYFFVTALHVAAAMNTVTMEKRTAFDNLVINIPNKPKFLIDVSGLQEEVSRLSVPPNKGICNMYIKQIDSGTIEKLKINTIEISSFLLEKFPKTPLRIFSFGFPSKGTSLTTFLNTMTSGYIKMIDTMKLNYESTMKVEEGRSGSPVFAEYKGSNYFIGILSAGDTKSSIISKGFFIYNQIKTHHYW